MGELECQLEHTNMAEDLRGPVPSFSSPSPCFPLRRERPEATQWGREDAYLVRAMTLFFLGCWFTGLPMLPFFREPFRASSRCFSAGEHGREAVSCPRAARPCCLGQPALGLSCARLLLYLAEPMARRHLMLMDMHLALHNLRWTVVDERRRLSPAFGNHSSCVGQPVCA